MGAFGVVSGTAILCLWLWAQISDPPALPGSLKPRESNTPILFLAAFLFLFAIGAKNVDWVKTIALVVAIVGTFGTVTAAYVKRRVIAAWLRSGWVRLFLVAWPMVAGWRWSVIDEDLAYWDDPLNGAPEKVLFQCVLAPPVLALAVRWVAAGFRRPST